MDELKIGDRIKDNDPRMGNRVLKVIDVLPDSVRAVDSIGNVRSYDLKRIFLDTKPRRTGFSRLPSDASPPTP
jgi:hypothetical protein